VSKNASVELPGPVSWFRRIGNLSGKWWIIGFKWAVFLAAFAYLYKKVVGSDSWEAVKAEFLVLEFSAAQWVFCGIACALMLVNWGIEAGKWKILMRKLERMPYSRAVVAVLAGNAVSLWMPNRAGEYLGRVVLLRPRTRIRGILVTLIGSFAQLAVTLIMGMAGLGFYIEKHWEAGAYFLTTAGVLAVAFAVLLLALYFSLNKIRYVVRGEGWRAKLRRYLAVYSIYTERDLGGVLFLSLIRYLVFSSQLVLMLLFFAVPVDVLTVLPSIFLIFLVQTVVPTTALSELAVRGAASVTFLEVSDGYTASVLAASYSIWLLNIILPSIAGAFVLLFIRLSRSSKRQS
jgi:hypothetical protein